MKRSALLLFAFLVCYSICKGQDRITAILESPDYKKASLLVDTKKDSAFYYFNEIADTSKDSLKVAMAYNRMADLQASAGDYFRSQETITISQEYLNKKDSVNYYCLTANYTVLGNTSFNLKKYDDALNYYDSAIKFNLHPPYEIRFLNNKALVYQRKQEYEKAITIFLPILEKAKTDTFYYAMILSNLARTKWLQNPGYNPRPELLTALEMRKKINSEWGLNASYAHLSDYYSKIKKDSALLFADKMYEVAKKLKSADDQVEALQKLIILIPSASMKNHYFDRYYQLNDSLQGARSTARNQFAIIQYDVKKSKAENLLLQQDNSEKGFRIEKQRLMIYGIIVASVILLAIGIFWYRKRKQRIQWESQNAIQQNQLKTSKKVHDVVANGLYRIMTDLEHKNSIEKNQLLDKIEQLYEQSRDISYEQPAGSAENFSAELHHMLISFATPSTRILIVGNQEKLWTNTTPAIKKDLEYALQEIMVNMSKHSKAQNVVINFKRDGDQLHIRYKDDGVGLPSGFQYGNGLKNTENRIKGIGGQVIFKSEDGLMIDISFPNKQIQ